MVDLKDDILTRIELFRKTKTEAGEMDPVEHCLARIKTESSMREKCRRKKLPETESSALTIIKDAIGIRIVCAFINDVYTVKDYLASFDDLTVTETKDYIRNAKPNGYRSLHVIMKSASGFYVEVQLRTISQDTWAALEHHIRYKKNIKGNLSLISAELKRCADELASTDVSMQAIKDLIAES